ncbi:MAG: putative baseplate assembly protein [Bryobacteraceae bacterium]
MPIPLPNLDDRRWADLVEQGRALVPLYAPEWTDHNASDPGITLMELFAFVAEMDIYRLNRIPDSHKLQFLALLGIRPSPPRSSVGVLELRHSHTPDPVRLPAGAEFSGTGLDGTVVYCRSTACISIAAGRLQTLQRRVAAGFQDLTAARERREPVALFGESPEPGVEFYLGFDAALPPGEWVSLYLAFQGGRTGQDERKRLIEESGSASLPPHHSVRLEWECFTAGGWVAAAQQDDTRSLTLDGAVRVRVPSAMSPLAAGKISVPRYYLRCRFASGGYDAPPLARRVLMNAAEVEQAVPMWQTWPIAKGAAVSGTASPGDLVSVVFKVAAGSISELTFESPRGDAPSVRVLGLVTPTASTAGSVTLEAVQAGTGNAEPNQALIFPRHPLIEASVRLYSLEGGTWRSWNRVDGFTASTRDSAHYELDPATGVVRCGDGERGRTFPSGSIVLVQGDATLAGSGSASITRIAASPRNLAMVKDPGAGTVTAGGQIEIESGQSAESLAHAIGRAIELREASLRAITVRDFETIAAETPGTQIARVTAIPNLYPGLDCVTAPGVVTVIVVPAMPGPRPSPDAGLLAAVAARLERRRIIGTRVVVVGPNYLEVAVKARVRGFEGIDKTRLGRDVSAAIDAFFHPLRGGPEGKGWPFGRDVFRSEVLQTIDEVPGVDCVLELQFFAEGCGPSCANLCLPATWLVASGRHEIEVVWS